MTVSDPPEPEVYDDQVVRGFVFFTMFWGAIGMLAGLWAALELAFWQCNLDSPYLSFGRLRPLHTNAVIFAFAGNAIFGSVYYSVQRLCRVRLASDFLSKFHLWGWQVIIALDAVCLLLGFTDGKEYAEPVFLVDLLITLVWVVFAVNFFWTLARRREHHLYVAIWFYIATIITIAVLHLVNNLSLPISPFKSYPVWAGVQDALIQWWYGHNAVGFLLTTPFLGMMYYYLPKAAEKPVYSYRLSIIHFWALIFLYIWAGPHHLHYTALPDWAQTLGMVFSVMLWMPSWGGMINGLMTLSGAWDKLRTNPALRFSVTAVGFYGMSTFEGPVMSIRAVNGLSHYTDWTIGHVHSGAMGWVGFITFGALYYLFPVLWRKKAVWSEKLIAWHFWLATLGIVFYITAMWVSGIMQGLMWRAYDELGFLQFSFVETVEAMHPYYVIRLLGGVLYLTGALIMAFNLWKTVTSSEEAAPAPVAAPASGIAVAAE